MEVGIVQTRVRNLLGGLLGGIAGILTAWYINEKLLPLGVFFGVVVGYWAKEIGTVVAIFCRGTQARSEQLTVNAREMLISFGDNLGIPKWLVKFLFAIPLYCVFKPLHWLIQAPGRFTRWYRKDYENKLEFFRLTSYFVFIAAGTLFMIIVAVLLGVQAQNQVLVIGASLLILAAAPLCYQERFNSSNDELAALSCYYRDREIVARFGFLGYIVNNWFQCALRAIGLAAYVVVVIAWTLFGTATSFFAILLIAAPMLVILKALYLGLTRTGHWLCFLVTLIVTGSTWLVARSSTHNSAMAWSLALLCGVAAGCLTELIRGALAKLLPHLQTASRRISTWSNLAPESEIDSFCIEEFIFFFIGNTRSARLLRHYLLGLPLYKRPAIIHC